MSVELVGKPELEEKYDIDSLRETYESLSGESADKRWSLDTLVEKVDEFTIEEQTEEIEVDNHPASFSYDESITQKFIFNELSGSDDFLDFLNQFMHEHIWIVEETDDINYYDWLFHQHLIDGFIAYSRHLLKEKNEECFKFLERLNVDFENGDNIVWHDIYTLIVKDNKGKRFAQYYEGVK